MFKKEIDDDHNNKPRNKLYKKEVLTALKKSWPELYSTDIARISRKDCNDWVARYGKKYSATRFNGALGIVRRIFEIAVEHGYRVDNPAGQAPIAATKTRQTTAPWRPFRHCDKNHKWIVRLLRPFAQTSPVQRP